MGYKIEGRRVGLEMVKLEARDGERKGQGDSQPKLTTNETNP